MCDGSRKRKELAIKTSREKIIPDRKGSKGQALGWDVLGSDIGLM